VVCFSGDIIAALSKLEVVLNKYSRKIHDNPKTYNFTIRQNILHRARDLKLVANNYYNRTYQNPDSVINNLVDNMHKLAAKIQLKGGVREVFSVS